MTLDPRTFVHSCYKCGADCSGDGAHDSPFGFVCTDCDRKTRAKLPMGRYFSCRCKSYNWPCGRVDPGVAAIRSKTKFRHNYRTAHLPEQKKIFMTFCAYCGHDPGCCRRAKR